MLGIVVLITFTPDTFVLLLVCAPRVLNLKTVFSSASLTAVAAVLEASETVAAAVFEVPDTAVASKFLILLFFVLSLMDLRRSSRTFKTLSHTFSGASLLTIRASTPTSIAYANPLTSSARSTTIPIFVLC